MEPSKGKSRWGTWLVLAVLVGLLGPAVVELYVGWSPGEDDVGEGVSGAGYIAMTLGILATLALGVGLMALMFFSNRSGRDCTDFARSQCCDRGGRRCAITLDPRASCGCTDRGARRVHAWTVAAAPRCSFRATLGALSRNGLQAWAVVVGTRRLPWSILLQPLRAHWPSSILGWRR